MEIENEKLVKNFFRDYMSREVNRAHVQEEKQKFLQTFHEPAPFFEMGWGIPSLLLAAIFAVFFSLRVPGASHAGTSGTLSMVRQVEALPEDSTQAYKKPRVMVKRVASQAGSTMIYQKSFRDISVTVIWVFPTGGPS